MNKPSGAEYFLRSVQITPYNTILTLVLPDGEEIKLTVFSEDVRKCDGENLDKAEFSQLVEAAEKYAAYKKSMDLLAYGDCSKKALTQKLRQRGYSSQSAQDAAALMEKKGFIHEAEHALRMAQSEARKKYGKARIAQKLFSKGFEQKYIAEAMEKLSQEVDFQELLTEYIDSHGLYDRLTDKDIKIRRRTVASLINRGFSNSEISSAIKELS